MFGPDATEDDIALYDVPAHLDASYPPTYLLYGARDASVPVENSIELARALEEHGVEHRRRPQGTVLAMGAIPMPRAGRCARFISSSNWGNPTRTTL